MVPTPPVDVVWLLTDSECRPTDPTTLDAVDRVVEPDAVTASVAALDDPGSTCLVAGGRAGLDLFEHAAVALDRLPPTLLVVDDPAVAEAARTGPVDEVVWPDAVHGSERLAVATRRAVDGWRARDGIAFEPLVEHAQDLLTVVGRDGRIRYANPAVEEILGYERDEFVGGFVFDYVHPDDRGDVAAETEAVLDSEDRTVSTSVYRARHADGSWRWLESVSQSENRTAPVEGFVVCSRDVTERVERERRLRRAERRFDAVFDDPLAFMGILDTDGRLHDVNERAREFVGVTADEVVGEVFWELPWWSHSAAERERARSAVERAAAGEVVRFKTTNVGDDGELVHLDTSLRPVTTDDGSVEAIVAEGIDIGDEVTATRERELLLDAIQSAAGSSDLDAALTATIRTVVASTETVYGEAWSPDGDELELRNAWWTDDPSLESFGRRSEQYRLGHGEGLPGRVWASGEPEWVLEFESATDEHLPRAAALADHGIQSAVGVPVLDDDGGVLTVLVFLTDASRGRDERFLELLTTITAHLGAILQRRVVEDQLAAERERQRRLLETSPVGILVVGSDGSLRQENRRAREILGVDDDETVAEAYAADPWRVTPESDDAPRLDDGWFQNVAHTDEAIRNEVYVVDQSAGERRWLLVNAAPVASGDETEVVVSFSDITEQKRHEQAFQNQAERVSVLNRVLRHDLRTHLTVVGGLLDRIEEQSDAPADAVASIRESIDDLETLSHRARRIEAAFESETRTAFDLPALVERAVADARAEHPSATYSLSLASVPPVQAHEHLRLALDNLLENAAVHNDGEPNVTVSVERHDETTVRLVVADDGPGIPETEIELREERLETALEHSDGLGLWIVRWLVSRSDGDLDLVRTADGSRAVVDLPVAPSAG